MESCKDCIHENLCVIKAYPDAFENTRWEKEPCDHFKPKTEWISVDERLPESNTRVLGYSRLLDEVCCYDIAEGTREIQWWTEDHGWYLASDLDITHWMPLPEPPMMKEGAGK